MKKEDIIDLAQWFSNSNLTSMAWKDGSFSIELKKEEEKNLSSFSVPVTQAISKEDSVKKELPVSEQAPQEKTPDTRGYLLHSPVVGTFYDSPSPEEESFVKVGQRVTKGQPLCIIEAMKLLNEIVSPVDGKIEKIFVQNEKMVEFDEVLMEIIED